MPRYHSPAARLSTEMIALATDEPAVPTAVSDDGCKPDRKLPRTRALVEAQHAACSFAEPEQEPEGRPPPGRAGAVRSGHGNSNAFAGPPGADGNGSCSGTHEFFEQIGHEVKEPLPIDQNGQRFHIRNEIDRDIAQQWGHPDPREKQPSNAVSSSAEARISSSEQERVVLDAMPVSRSLQRSWRAICRGGVKPRSMMM